MKYDVVIVGAGAAGLVSAAYLCRYGYRVLLCEKNGKTGGLVSSFEYNDFVFDGGIRAFENSGIIVPMLKQLGISMDFFKSPVSIRIGDDIILINSRESLNEYQELLCRYFPENIDDISKIINEIKKVVEYMDVLYGIDNPLFIDDFLADREYLAKTLFPWIIKYLINIKKASALFEPINDYLEKFTANKSLIDIITQHFFKNTPAFFALSYFGQYSDYIYPAGGTGVLADKLCEYINNHGGIIQKNTRITGVDAAKQEIKTGDGRLYRYNKLIWACSSDQLCNILSGIDFMKNKKAAQWRDLVKQNHGGDSVYLYLLV